jgi:nitrogen fixation/metabolism regulation signal transduction histidine kinase
MLRSSATGLIAVDENGYVEHINEAALEFLAMPYISHIDILRQRNPEFYTHLQVIKPGQSRMVKVLYNNGLRLFSLKVAVLVFDDKKYRVYSISDIKAELEENELDSWQKLIRVMTHEIMNSVAPITSMSNTMSRILTKESKPLPVTDLSDKHISDVLEGLAVIENTGKGLMKFVDNYRRLTKIPNPVFLPVNIENWLNTIRLLTAERLSNENTELQIMNKSQAVTFTGDEKMLSQVMINLINNATDALIDTEKKVIRIQVSDGVDGRLKINVSDNGKGINDDDIEKIFIPFYTTKENGSGIGLSLSRKIMRLHKGSLSASSVQGEMTTFTLSF